MDDKMLTQIAREIFTDYQEVSARFDEHIDLKVRWIRTPSKEFIDLRICDYLKEIPIEMMVAFLKCLSVKMRGEDAPYPDAMCEYLDSEEFRVGGEACNLSLHMERMKKYMPDLDYDTESEVNERVYDMLLDLEDKGYKVAPVTVGTTSEIIHPMHSGNPWLLSLLFKEIILQKDFIEQLDDDELEAVLEALLDVIHTDFKEVAGEPCPDIRQMIFNNLIDEDAMEELYKKLERFKE